MNNKLATNKVYLVIFPQFFTIKSPIILLLKKLQLWNSILSKRWGFSGSNLSRLPKQPIVNKMKQHNTADVWYKEVKWFSQKLQSYLEPNREFLKCLSLVSYMGMSWASQHTLVWGRKGRNVWTCFHLRDYKTKLSCSILHGQPILHFTSPPRFIMQVQRFQLVTL